MTDREIDQLLRGVDPYDARAIDLRGADEDLLEEIMHTDSASRRSRGFRSRIVGAVAMAAALTAAVGIPAALSQRADEGSQAAPPDRTAEPTQTTQIRYTSAAIKIARANPRILVTAPDWKVRHLGGFSATSGEMGFQLGPDRWKDEDMVDENGAVIGSSHLNLAPSLSIDWYPAASYESYLADRAIERNVQTIEVFGRKSQMVSYSATDHAVMLPPENGVWIELRGGVGDEAAFKRFLAESIAKVDVPTWLAALPPEMVTAGNAGDRLEEVLADIPVPPGFERTGLEEAVALDRYQFGARVTGAVTCGWLRSWESGDAAAKRRAVEALATSREWDVLQEMDTDGDYPEAIWQYANELAEGRISQGYREGLGC